MFAMSKTETKGDLPLIIEVDQFSSANMMMSMYHANVVLKQDCSAPRRIKHGAQLDNCGKQWKRADL